MTNLFFTSAALMFLQVGPNPAANDTLGTPEELRDRPARGEAVQRSTLTQCLRQTTTDPQTALDTAQRWRENGETDLDFAQSAHCLGLALVKLGRIDEARQAFELASAEASGTNIAYAARLAAMAGNAAVSEGDLDGAIDLLDRAGGMALAEGEKELAADLRVDLARVLVRADRQEDAALALTEAREADTMDAEAWLLSATLSRRMERLGEAFEQIRRAALLDPRNPQVGLEAGVIAALSGRSDDARESFESVLQVAPGTPAAERAQSYLDQLDSAPEVPEPLEE